MRGLTLLSAERCGRIARNSSSVSGCRPQKSILGSFQTSKYHVRNFVDAVAIHEVLGEVPDQVVPFFDSSSVGETLGLYQKG